MAKSHRRTADQEVGPPVPMQERILSVAIDLFNERGVQDVAAMHIARELDISPGHLSYHFKSKQAIIAALFPQIDFQVRQVLEEAPRREQSVEFVATYQIRIFKTLWLYRFFFNGLSYILIPDEPLYREYLALQTWMLTRLQQLNDQMIEFKLMRPIEPPNSTALLARNIWTIWLGWLRLEQISNPETTIIERKAILDGALQHFSLCQPYYGRKFSAQLLAEIHRQLDAL